MGSLPKTILLLALTSGLPAAVGCMDEAVARAGADRTVDAGETVTLDGSASTPSAKGKLEFLWEVADGPEVSFGDARAQITSFTAPREPSETILRIRLTVTFVDLSGQPYPPNSDTDEVVIRVHADRTAPESGSTLDQANENDAAASTDGLEAGTDGLQDDGTPAAKRSGPPS
ncbi:MAG: PKD domain-containing protein [Planctomycetota bacterium]|jgi:hypothetical protein